MMNTFKNRIEEKKVKLNIRNINTGKRNKNIYNIMRKTIQKKCNNNNILKKLNQENKRIKLRIKLGKLLKNSERKNTD